MPGADKYTGGQEVAPIPPRLIRPVDLTALAADKDVTLDPADGTTPIGFASGIYSAAGGTVALMMLGSTTPSTFTLAAGGVRNVLFSKIMHSGTAIGLVEISYG